MKINFFFQPGVLSLNLDNYTNFVQKNKKKRKMVLHDEAPLSEHFKAFRKSISVRLILKKIFL